MSIVVQFFGRKVKCHILELFVCDGSGLELAFRSC